VPTEFFRSLLEEMGDLPLNINMGFRQCLGKGTVMEMMVFVEHAQQCFLVARDPIV
jgi:hypothetical protein